MYKVQRQKKYLEKAAKPDLGAGRYVKKTRGFLRGSSKLRSEELREAR